MRLRLSRQKERRTRWGFEIAVIAAALATIPLTYMHIREWDSPFLPLFDWLLWAIFAADYGFALAVSENRWHTTKAKWVSPVVVIVSFPLLPHLLSLTRVVRLIQPLWLLGGLGIGRPLVLLRLYVIRSAAGRRIFRSAKGTGNMNERE